MISLTQEEFTQLVGYYVIAELSLTYELSNDIETDLEILQQWARAYLMNHNVPEDVVQKCLDDWFN